MLASYRGIETAFDARNANTMSAPMGSNCHGFAGKLEPDVSGDSSGEQESRSFK